MFSDLASGDGLEARTLTGDSERHTSCHNLATNGLLCRQTAQEDDTSSQQLSFNDDTLNKV